MTCRFTFENGREATIELPPGELRVQVTRAPVRSDLYLFCGALTIWILDQIFIRDPLHNVLMLLLLPLGYRALKPLVAYEIRIFDQQFRAKTHLFGIGLVEEGPTDELEVRPGGLYYRRDRLMPLPQEAAPHLDSAFSMGRDFDASCRDSEPRTCV